MQSSLPLIMLLRREMSTPGYILVLLAGLAGIGNALVMAIINNAAGDPKAAEDLRTIVMFALTIGVYVVAQRALMRITAREVETVIHRLRVTLIRKISQADLLPLEQIGRSDILGAIIRDTQTISQAANFLVIACQSAILIVLALGYVFLVNTTAFFLCFGFIATSVMFVLRRLGELREQVHVTFAHEHRVFDGLRDVLDGFKEVKMSARRRDALLTHVDAVSATATDLKITTQSRSATEFVVGQSLLLMLLGLMVFVVPVFAQMDSSAVTRTTTAVLFIIGPLGMVVQAVPMLAGANAAAEHLARLDQMLGGLSSAEGGAVPKPLPEEIAAIDFDGVCFTYQDPRAASSFTVGPIDLTIAAGEILFITGGNGSGKSTLMKLLVGLYHPDRGVIRAGGVGLSADHYEAYRSSFSVIFADFHLFRKLYGIDPPTAQEFTELCEMMEMTGKTRLTGDEFDSIELSTGQRKRLALLLAIVEDKPIMVFDEWAADQDPHFRRKFYQELLPLLQTLGKTIVAVTHDDRYFGMADRRIAMEEGRIASVVETSAAERRALRSDAQ